MKRLALFATLFFAQTTFAEQPEKPAAPENKTASALVQTALVEPLAAKERQRSKFSRAAMPAQERRVRILDEQPRKDAQGAAFVRFAVDARHGVLDDSDAGWNLAAITGCAYVERGEVFVKKGDQFRAAAFLLGKNVKAAPAETCVGETQVARAD